MASAQVQTQYRRTVRWTLCVVGVCVMKSVGLKMPRRLLLWCARRPGQYRAGNGPWQTIKLDPEEIKRRFG